jgi:flagellar export protein FliJ
MPKSHRFVLQKVMDLRADQALKALQVFQKEEAELIKLQQAKANIQQCIQNAYDSFQNAQGYDYGLHFPLYIQEQRNYEAKISQDITQQEKRCEEAKAVYVEAKIKEKSLEKLKAKQHHIWKQELALQDAHEMDEMGLRQFRQSV